MKDTILSKDKIRYHSGKMPVYQKYYRKSQTATPKTVKRFYKLLLYFSSQKYHVEINSNNQIGAGLYIGHPYEITINPQAVIGTNCNIHKGVTIGQENRGQRKGVPKIGNYVWIGVNATVVGNISVGDDVLIAPNTYVNCDVPSHSVVFGNPCIIKPCQNATEGYINNTVLAD